MFQVVDYYPAYSGAAIRAIERADYAGADHIFVIGETLRRYLLNEHGVESSRITVLGQGVFTELYAPELPMPQELQQLPRPIGIWVGVLEKADPTLFRAAAAALRDQGGSLALIGPSASWVDELRGDFSNVHTIGPRPPETVPAYLVHADIGLMLYDQTRQQIYRGQNPLKLYEFAAAGLPVISTPHDEFQYLNPPVIEVTAPGHLREAIDEALSRRELHRARSLSFAARHSWQAAFDEARTRIETLLQVDAAA